MPHIADQSQQALPDPIETPMVNIKAAAKILGIGVSLAYEMAADGTLPSQKFGTRVLIPTVELWRIARIKPPCEAA